MYLRSLSEEFTANLPSDERGEEEPTFNLPETVFLQQTITRERSQVVTDQYWAIDYDELSYS